MLVTAIFMSKLVAGNTITGERPSVLHSSTVAGAEPVEALNPPAITAGKPNWGEKRAWEKRRAWGEREVEGEIVTLPISSATTPSPASAGQSRPFKNAINSGIEEPLIDEVRKVSRQLFDLSMEEKQKYGRAPDDTEGYGNDMVLSENQTLDWTDRPYLLVHPEDERKLKYWPENPKSFRVNLEEYSSRLKLIAEELLRSIARSMNLLDDRFLRQYGDRPVMYARFSFYSPCPRPKLVHGIKPHADGSAITILLQDKEVGGLQILKDDK
ncbi:hypothetical protein CQW23_32000 [Capsicum baccatum]|uniref:Protein SRG1 n=1 Tax=Capsicum baccatum TaxID=33114 RepID=A0A2G2V5Z2_CAPBA|nr:hypothetical protein CQW23_32000 [Capsicum baccatum]